jgi:hypothetical protein
MAIDYGQLIECEINPVGDMDTFTFSGTAHDQIVIVLHGKSLDSGPCATLINPNGAVIVPEQCNVFADTHFVMIRTVLTVTGTYSVVINEHANNELNRYLFAVLRESNSALFAQAAVTVTAPSDATFGQSGLTATASGGSGTGAYSFNAAGSTACSVAASTGAITVTSGTGTCSITATRAGDADYKASAASAPATVTIHKADTTTTLTSSDANNTTVFGESVTFTATVAVVDPGSGTPTGRVGFLDGATSLGTVALAGLNASLTTSTLSVSGSPHSITTKYLGDTNFNVSTSAVISHTVDTVDRIAFAKARIASAGAIVAALPPSQVTTPGNKTAFGNFLKEAIGQLQNGNVAAAIQKLNMAIERTDGCALRMAVDGNGAGRDWITSCAAQIEVYNLLNGALNALIP